MHGLRVVLEDFFRVYPANTVWQRAGGIEEFLCLFQHKNNDIHHSY